MQLYILDNNFNRIGIIDDYECLIWKRNYYKTSEFTMQLIPNFEQFEMLKKGMILLKTDNTKEAMYINHRELSQNEEGIETLIVSGYGLENWLNMRITLYKELQKGNAETVIRNYINSNCISPKDNNRIIPNLVQGNDNNLGENINYNSHYKQLIEEVENISKSNELGFRIDLDLASQKYIFEVFKGLDRTVEQVENSIAIFSTEFENIAEQKYIDSENDFKNYILVAGAGEGTKRKTYTLGDENIGFDRYELFVDARDISDTTENDAEIPLETYNKLLEARANEKISECTKIETFDCKILNTNSLIYRSDFDLGDKVSIINKKWGLLLHERIVSIEEVYNEEGLNINIEIGNNIPTMIDKIKKMR